MLTQTYQLTLDDFPEEKYNRRDYIRLPFPPLQEIVSFQVIDTQGNETEFEDYELDKDSSPARVFLKSYSTWPSSIRERAGIKITYKCGYETPEEVPENWIHAIRILVNYWYENREAVVIEPGAMAEQLPLAFNSLLHDRVVEYRP